MSKVHERTLSFKVRVLIMVAKENLIRVSVIFIICCRALQSEDCVIPMSDHDAAVQDALCDPSVG